MKTRTKRLLIIVALLAALGIGFFAGKAVQRREDIQSRQGHGRTLLSFAVGNLERLRDGEAEDFQDEVEDLASNIYAAYYDFLSDETVAFSDALWELWNALLFDIENLPGNEDALIEALTEQDADRVEEIAAGMRMPG